MGIALLMIGGGIVMIVVALTLRYQRRRPPAPQLDPSILASSANPQKAPAPTQGTLGLEDTTSTQPPQS